MFILGIDMQKVRFLTLLVVVLLTAAIQFLSARGRMLFNKDTLRFCSGTSCRLVFSNVDDLLFPGPWRLMKGVLTVVAE